MTNWLDDFDSVTDIEQDCNLTLALNKIHQLYTIVQSLQKELHNLKEEMTNYKYNWEKVELNPKYRKERDEQET